MSNRDIVAEGDVKDLTDKIVPYLSILCRVIHFQETAVSVPHIRYDVTSQLFDSTFFNLLFTICRYLYLKIKLIVVIQVTYSFRDDTYTRFYKSTHPQ